MMKKKTYHIVTFGCQMNERDSETLAGMLEEIGYEWIEEKLEADVVILNTCSVRENADKRFLGVLGQLKHTRENRLDMVVAVCGCMMQQEHIIDMLNKNKNVCFEVDKMYEMLPSKNPCSYDMKYRSVVGFGTATILEDDAEKREGLKVITDRYHKGEYDINKMNVKGLAVIRIDIWEMQGRENNMK